MAQDTKISELPQTTALAGDELLPLVQSGQTCRATVATLRSGLAPAAHTHTASAITDASAAGRSLLTAADATAQRTALGLGSMATQLASAVALTGGSINGTPIGATTASTGKFTTATVTGSLYTYGPYSATADASSVAMYLRGRSDSIGSMIFQNNAGNVTQAGFSSWPGSFRLSGPGAELIRLTATDVQFGGPAFPMADNTHSFGTSGLRWKDIYAANAVIQTSDERAKTDIADCPLGLDFILALRPVRYRFKDIDEPAVTVRRTVERAVTAPAAREREEVRCIDGQHRLVTVTEAVEEPVLRLVPLFDAEGRPLSDEAGNPRLHPVPVTETVEEVVVERPACTVHHRRPHDGLIAQEVKAVLDGLGLDMAGYVYDQSADRHGLRYGEFIAPLIRAVQELAGRVAVLERAAAH